MRVVILENKFNSINSDYTLTKATDISVVSQLCSTCLPDYAKGEKNTSQLSPDLQKVIEFNRENILQNCNNKTIIFRCAENPQNILLLKNLLPKSPEQVKKTESDNSITTLLDLLSVLKESEKAKSTSTKEQSENIQESKQKKQEYTFEEEKSITEISEQSLSLQDFVFNYINSNFCNHTNGNIERKLIPSCELIIFNNNKK